MSNGGRVKRGSSGRVIEECIVLSYRYCDIQSVLVEHQ